MQELGCGHQHLLGHTAAQGTSSADISLFHHANRHARVAGDIGCGQAGIARADG